MKTPKISIARFFHQRSLLTALAAFLCLVSSASGAQPQSAYAPVDDLGPKWTEFGWVNDSYFPWVWSYTYSMWYCLYDGVDADTTDKGYWIGYYTPDLSAYGWGYVVPGYGWWCFTLDFTPYWLYFGDALPADGKVLRVTIMIDDGPSANTEGMLSVLKTAGVRANFDLIGKNAEASPSTVLAIYNAGHEINAHGYNHAVPTTLSDADLAAEVTDCRDAIADITGEAPHWYWPPYINLDSRLYPILSDAGMEMCRCSTIVSSDDYVSTTTADEIKSNVVDRVYDGSVLLFHEWRDDTVTMMPSIIEALREKGCVFLPYADLDAYLDSK